MNVVGNRVIHEVSAHYGWKEGSKEKVLLHGALGALTGSMSGKGTWTGALSGSVNEFAVKYIEQTKEIQWVVRHPDVVQGISVVLGAMVGKVIGNAGVGAYTAQMGTKYNALSKEQERQLNVRLKKLNERKDVSINDLISILQVYENLGEADEHIALLRSAGKNQFNIYLKQNGEKPLEPIYVLSGITVTAPHSSQIDEDVFNQTAKRFGLDTTWNREASGLENVRQLLSDAEWKKGSGHTWFQSANAEYVEDSFGVVGELAQGTRYSYLTEYTENVGYVMDAMGLITNDDRTKSIAEIAGGLIGYQVGAHLITPLLYSTFDGSGNNVSKYIKIGSIFFATSIGQNIGQDVIDNERNKINELKTGGSDQNNDNADPRSINFFDVLD